MKNNQNYTIKYAALSMLCFFFIGWLFTLPIPEFNPTYRSHSAAALIIDNSGVDHLKGNDVGITSNAARFNGVPELREIAQQERATLSFLFSYKNFTYVHTRLFYNSLSFINCRYSVHPPGFFILFRKLRL